jgi:transcriptional regulator with XRE-family HTH domain
MKDIKALYERIGSKISYYRGIKEITQAELAKEAKLHYSYIAHLERGRKVASVKSLEKIASALEVPLYELFTSGEEKFIDKKVVISVLENFKKDSKKLECSVMKVLDK